MKVNPNLTPNITKSWAPPFFQTYTHSQTPFRTMKFLKGAIQVIAPTPLAQSWHPLRINSICHCQAIPVPCFFFVSRTWDKLDSCHPQLASTVGFIQIGVSNEQVPVQVRAVEKKYSVGEFGEEILKISIFCIEILDFLTLRNWSSCFFWEAHCRRQGALSISGSFSSRSWCQPAAKLVGHLVLIPKEQQFFPIWKQHKTTKSQTITYWKFKM